MKTNHFQLFITLCILLFFLQSCSTKTNTIIPDENYLITPNSIGNATLGQTIAELKQAYKGFTFTLEPVFLYGVDGESNGLKISKNNEDYLFVWTMQGSDKIHCIVALNKKFHTLQGFKPKVTTAGELKKYYPKMQVELSLEFDELEYFSDSSINYVFKSNDSTFVGKYSDDYYQSDVYNENKTISYIEVYDKD